MLEVKRSSAATGMDWVPPRFPLRSRAMSELRRGRLLLLFAGILWSLGGVFVKSIEAPAPVISTLRGLFAALVLLPLVRRRPSGDLRVMLSSIVLYTGVVGLFVWSTKLTSAANAIILQYTAPAFVFLIQLALLRRSPPPAERFTLAGGMVGIAIIYAGTSAGDFLGVSLAVLSGFLFAAWIVVLGNASDVDPVAMTVANNLGAAILLAPFALASGAALPPPSQLGALAVMGALQLGVPYLLFMRGVRAVGPQEASLIVLVEPVLNPIWVRLVVGETPAPTTLIGGAIVVLTLVVRYLPRRRPG